MKWLLTRWAPYGMMIVFVTALALSTASAVSAVLLDKVVAIVNKDVITWSEVYKAMEFEVSERLKSLPEQERRKAYKEQESVFIDMLIEVRLQLQEAQRLNIIASEDEVKRAMEALKKKYALSDEQFKEMIAKEGFTDEEYKKKLIEQIVISRLVDQEVRSKVYITEREIDTYMTARPDLPRESEGYVISIIFLKNDPTPAATEEKALELYQSIKGGQRFDVVAARVSEDPSAKAGGSLGFVKKADLSKEFLAALSELKVGDVSQPIITVTGVYLLRLDEVRSINTPQELRNAVKEKLLEERFNKEYRQWLKGLREKAYVEVK